MPQAVSNRAKIGVSRETAIGTTNASPVIHNFRLLSATLSGKPKTKVSGEIVSTRMVADLILVGKDQDGAVGHELSYHKNYTAQSLLIESAFWSAWNKTPECDNAAVPTACGTIAAATDYPVTTGQAFVVNMLVSATGFTTPANNKILAALAATSTTTIKTSGLTLEAATANSRLKCIGFQGASADVLAAITPTRLTSTTTVLNSFGLVPGQWVLIGTNQVRSAAVANDAFSFQSVPANNNWSRVLSVAATALVFDIAPSGFAVDAGATKTIRVFFGDYVRNGTSPLSQTVEQQHPDLAAPAYVYYTGMFADTMSVKMAAQDLIKCEFGLKGLNTLITTTRVATPTDVSPPANDVQNTSSNIGRIAENGSAITGSPGNYVLSIDWMLDNKLRLLPAIGQIGYIAGNPGQSLVTGSAKFYFADTSIFTKALANTATSLDYSTQDAAGNAYTIDLPKVKLATATQDVGTLDADLTVDTTFQSLQYTHPTNAAQYDIHLQRSELAGTAL